MGCLRKDSTMAIASAAVWLLCCVLALQSAAYTAQAAEENIDRFPSSLITEEARGNLARWLNYVHSTSDADEEPWAERLEVDEALLSTNETRKHHHHHHHKKDHFKPKHTIVVAKDGSGHFRTIQAAIDHIPKVNNERVLIRIKAGVYREQVKIPSQKQYITMEGERPYNHGSGLRTIIEYNATAADLDKNGLPLKTFRTATVAVNAKYFIAKYITIKNTAPQPLPGAVGGQAVALRVSADMAAFYWCRFYGKQDTLYDHSGRHYFQRCFAEGTIDFVFGNGRSLYEKCHLTALANNGTFGTITAQKRNATLPSTGFAFVSSMVTGYGSAYLGRAWGNDSRVVFANTFMSKVVIPEGWNDWGIPAREKTVFYAEYNCTGPGANSTGRVNWSEQLSFTEAKPFLSIGFINGKNWLQNPKQIEADEKKRIAAEALQDLESALEPLPLFPTHDTIIKSSSIP